MRHLTKTQGLLSELDRALRTLMAPKSLQLRETPVAPTKDDLNHDERRHSAGLMRINHAGEVAAQALYFGHAKFATQPATRAHMLHAAAEEGDHLAWCAARLSELGAKPSLASPAIYAGAYVMGAVSALAGDQMALGFVAETERQVEAHLADHQARLPKSDTASLAILTAMRADEIAHGQQAIDAGGKALPWPIAILMTKAADLMRLIAYRV